MIKNQSYIKASWIIFILSPFLMFLLAFQNIFNKNNQRIFIFFSFLYGYSVFLFSGDILNYEETFYEVIEYNWNDFLYLLTHSLSPEKANYYKMNSAINKPDIYSLTLSFIISRFTENPRWFWAFASAIYTFIVLIFFNFINERSVRLKASNTQKIFFIGLIFIIPFYVGVTGIRFWPALFIYTTYSLKYLENKKINYFLLASLSVLFHYSFIFPVFILFILTFLPKNRQFYKLITVMALFIFTLSTVTSSLNSIKNISSNFEDTNIESSMDAYTNDEALEERNLKTQKANWYVRLKTNSTFYFLVFIGLLDIFGFFNFKENSFLVKTYPLFVVFLIIALLTNELGSIGRFKNVFFLLILSRLTILSGLQIYNKSLRSTSILFVPILVLHILVIFRAGFYTVEPTLLINNMLGVFFAHSDISLSELLIGH